MVEAPKQSHPLPPAPLLLILLVPLFYSVSKLQLIWAPPPERGQFLSSPFVSKGRRCLPPPTAPRRPDRLMLGPAAGQHRPDCLQCQGVCTKE
uniref:Uncharacterized protein n=1 Tax=Leersia perrieri TaxID=77586 RepID=A0A0D9XXB2_9ORYZ